MFTAHNAFTKLHSANVSAASITAPVPTTTEPTGNGVFRAAPPNLNAAVPSVHGYATLAFYGTRTAADNETFTAAIYGWRKVGTLWIPVPLLALDLTQGTSVGVALADVVATEYFADTITASSAFTNAYEIQSPANNSVAAVKLDLCGCDRMEVRLAKGTNATCNALAAAF